MQHKEKKNPESAVFLCASRWCGPCKILGPRLEKAVAKQNGRVAMAKVDIDDHTDLAIEYGVSLNVGKQTTQVLRQQHVGR